MPIRNVAGTDLEYFLLTFDALGKELRETGDIVLSDVVSRRMADAERPVTDVFLSVHGWKGDVPAAIEQYDKWVGAMGALRSDRDAARQLHKTFAPLTICLHWPSLPWGDETSSSTSNSLLSFEDARKVDLAGQVDLFTSTIADGPDAREAITLILEDARRHNIAGTKLPLAVRDAYATLFSESCLASSGIGGRPGADQDGFDPEAIIAGAHAAAIMAEGKGSPALLKVGDVFRSAFLMPLRQLSFWKMKDRAREFGESGAHDLLVALQRINPSTRFHLMGHSFGCIVMSAAVAGTSTALPLPRPIDSLFLVQGAVSLWAYTDKIPYEPSHAGYFNRIVDKRLVRGPILTTRSTFDTAVGSFYPLGARLKQQYVLTHDEYPLYGGIGAHGIRGLPNLVDITIQSDTFAYNFRAGEVYNIDASRVIRNGRGPSGAHSDIAHPEVAHAFWAAALTGQWGLLGAEFASSPIKKSGRIFEQGRWLNAEIEYHNPDEPLHEGEWYTLAFSIDVSEGVSAVGAVLFSETALFPDEIDEVLLTVQVDSQDFEISDQTRPIRLPLVGKSHTKARFDIRPRHKGTSIIDATIHKDGNFIQRMQLTFRVGAGRSVSVKVTSVGRPATAAQIILPRDVGLSITPGIDGYECVVWGAVAARARLPLRPAFLAAAIDAAREELMKVVTYRNDAGNCVFQTSVDVADQDLAVALRTMARAGARLFQQLFFGPSAGEDSKRVGEFLRAKASNRSTRLQLQIVAESTPVPWGLLYVGDASANAELSWDNFIGMRHLIEQIPLQNSLTVVDSAIRSDQQVLSVGVNLNCEIDTQMSADFVVRQRAFWDDAAATRKGVRVVTRTTRAQVLEALADGTMDDQILYFYCHARSTGLTDVGGPDKSCLVLTDAPITLGDLNLDAPPTMQLNGSPLVFINACESAEMSPAFYDGFVPYFMAKGARGVIGTECKTPALFAMVWAKRFFERFLEGESLGEAFLALRREFLDDHKNPLGLVYAVHCDGDTRIRPAVPVVS